MIDRKYEPVKGLDEEGTLSQSMGSILTVCESLQRSQPPNCHHTTLQYSLAIVDDSQCTPHQEHKIACKDSESTPSSQTVTIDLNVVSEVKLSGSPVAERVQFDNIQSHVRMSEKPSVTSSSVSSDYICADSPVLTGLSQSTSSDRDSCFSLMSNS